MSVSEGCRSIRQKNDGARVNNNDDSNQSSPRVQIPQKQKRAAFLSFAHEFIISLFYYYFACISSSLHLVLFSLLIFLFFFNSDSFFISIEFWRH